MPTDAMRQLLLPSGETIPALGLGTWGWAEDPSRRSDEIAAVHAGLDIGLNLIDTAEMYGDGAAESLLGEALGHRRDEAFLVSKVLPQHASRENTVAACERTLRRLGTDRVDLYLLHWRGSQPLADTLEAFDELTAAGKIRYWGVSNFDRDDIVELHEQGGTGTAVNQVLYNLTRRGIEYDLLPFCTEHRLPVMAYSPIEQGRLLDNPVLDDLAAAHGASPAVVALAWVLRREGICAIPRASTPARVADNRTALDLRLTDDDLAALDAAFPAPAGPTPLEIL